MLKRRSKLNKIGWTVGVGALFLFGSAQVAQAQGSDPQTSEASADTMNHSGMSPDKDLREKSGGRGARGSEAGSTC